MIKFLSRAISLKTNAKHLNTLMFDHVSDFLVTQNINFFSSSNCIDIIIKQTLMVATYKTGRQTNTQDTLSLVVVVTQSVRLTTTTKTTTKMFVKNAVSIVDTFTSVFINPELFKYARTDLLALCL
jgi:hypothetical protein